MSFNTSGFEKLFELIAGGVAGLIGAPVRHCQLCDLPTDVRRLLLLLQLVWSCSLRRWARSSSRCCRPLGLGRMARVYIINVLTFHFWGVIYSILGALITAVNLSTVQQVLNIRRFHRRFRRAGAGAAAGRRFDFLFAFDRRHSVSGGAHHSRGDLWNDCALRDQQDSAHSTTSADAGVNR